MREELNLPAQLREFSKKNNGKKRPKDIRKTIIKPLLIGVSVISVIMIVFFNIVFCLMLYSGVINDLKSISGMLEQVAINENISYDNANKVIGLYKSELDRYSISYRMNLVILNEDNRIVANVEDFQRNEKEMINENLYNLSKKYRTDTFKMKIEDDVLVFIPVVMKDLENGSVFIYASVRSLWNTIKWGNRALLVIVVIAFLSLFIASHIIAHNISKPIKDLSEHMEIVGDGNFSPVAVSDSSAEMENLTLSINEMLKRLQAYHDAHTRSIQNLSHDLKTPLMSIGGYAEGIKYGVFDDNTEATDIIIKESKRLTNVVEKMLILSELDALQHPINMTSIDFNEYLDDEIKVVEGYALQNKVKIIKDYSNSKIKVVADNQLIKTIVDNLLSNAIRYAKNNVLVKVIENDESVCLYVADDGIGLTAEDLEYLFVRYYVGKTGHTGLGLSAAKSAAEYMGCNIKGENRNTLPEDHPCFNDSGAVFTVVFPKF